jgi:branched-chain amino acid transport system substrate-binding protein
VRAPSGAVPRPAPLTAAVLASALLLAACLGEDVSDRPAQDLTPVMVDTTLGVVRVPAGQTIDVRLVIDGPEDDEALAGVLEAAFRTALEDFGVVQQVFRVEFGTAVTTTCSQDDGVRIGEELAGAESLVAVLGPQCTSTLLGLQGPLSEAGLVVVAPRPSYLTLTVGADGLPGRDRAPGVWRTAPSLLMEAQAAAQYAAEELGRSRAVTLHDGGPEAAELVAAFRDRFQSSGGTVVLERVLDDDAFDGDEEEASAALEELLAAILAGSVDVAFLVLEPPLLNVLADGWSGRTRLANVTRLVTSQAATEDFLGHESSIGHLLAGPSFDDLELVSSVTGMSGSQTRERIAALSGDRAPAGWWAHAYDAATLVLKAIEDASLIDADGTLVISRAELRETLAVTGFAGLSGPVACTPLGDCAAPRIVIRSLDDANASTLAELRVVARIG